MNEEAQELLNRQFDKRIAKLENNIENISKDLAEIRCDVKTLIKSYENLTQKWEEFDKQQRKNVNDVKMKFILTIVSAIASAILVAIGLK